MNVVMMKGAPEIVLTKCSNHLHNREEKPIDEVGRRAHGLPGQTMRPASLQLGAALAAGAAACVQCMHMPHRRCRVPAAALLWRRQNPSPRSNTGPGAPQQQTLSRSLPPPCQTPRQAFKSSMLSAYESCGFMGERVIGFAYK